MIGNLKLKIKNLKLKWGWVVIAGLLIIALFFTLRLWNLTILPVFADEAIYIRWSQVMRAEPTLRFLPLSDGKQPLFMWLTIPFLKVFLDPLVAGRMVSVLAGLGTLVGLFLLSLVLFKSKRIGLLTTLFYAVVPFTVFFDRMALVDSLLSMFGVWVLYLGVLLVRYQRLDLAMVTGMVLGGALLTKSPATFFAILLPATVLLSIKPKKDFAILLIKLMGLWLVVWFFAYTIYNILRLGPNFQMLALRNQDYIFPLSHAFTNPLDPLQFHLLEIWQWFGTLLTWPIFLIGLVGIIFGLKKHFKPTVLISLWIIFPLFVQAELAKVFTARYLLFAVPFFLIFVALFWEMIFEKIRVKSLTVVIFSVFLVFPLHFDFQLLTNPQKAPLPRRDREGYLELWTAGYGLREIADYIRAQAKEKSVVVGTEGAFGTLPDGLQIYLEKVPGVVVVGTGQINIYQVPQSLKDAIRDNLTYLVVNDTRMHAEHEPTLVLLQKFPKAQKPDGTQENLLFYQVIVQ